MSSRSSTLTVETDVLNTEVSHLNFDALLDKISVNMERAANVRFSKPTVNYALPSPQKRRRFNDPTLTDDERSLELSFISNPRPLSRASDHPLPALVTIRGPSDRDLGFLEAIDDPEYLHAVKELAELPDSSAAYDTIRPGGGSEVDEDCVYFSSLLDKFELSERMLTDYVARARSLFSLGGFHPEKDQLESIEQRYQRILAKTEYIYERLGQLPPSETHPPSQDLSAIEAEVLQLEAKIQRLGHTNSELTQACEQLRVELAAVKRKADERADPLRAEKQRMQALEVDLACAKQDLEGVKGEVASVTEEIAQLEAEGTPHPMYLPLHGALTQLADFVTKLPPESPPPEGAPSEGRLIDDLANKLLRRIEQIIAGCQNFTRPSLELSAERDLQRRLVSCLVSVPPDRLESLGLPSTVTLGAFVMKRLFEAPGVPRPLDELKREAQNQLGFDVEQAETAIFDLASRDLIVIDHSSLLVTLPPTIN